MNGKTMKSESCMSDKLRADMLNPFVHKLEIDNTYDKIKTALLTVVLLPFRVVVICVLIVSAWFLACIGLFGISEAELRQRPMTGWRRSLKPLICFIGKMSYLAGGMAITVRGKQATRAEAPILVVAPHSSFLDSCIVYATQMSTVIVRKESMDNYVGKLINYTQPVYVWRDDPNSRQNTIKEIIARATSKQDWPQILIFPEGTCTNRSCLITFKPGGFYPGVPVQPVTIRYPNALDTVTWTWEGPGALKLLWLTLTQLHSSCEIEFLPVYYPNEEEKRNPKLYARNVRDVMAKALNIPVMDYTYDDCRLIARAKQLGVPCAADAVRIHDRRQMLGLDNSRLELHLAAKYDKDRPQWLNHEQFAKCLGVPCDERSGGLFDIFKHPNTDLVCWPDYLLCAVFLSLQNSPLAQVINYAFKLYDESGTGRINAAIFERIATRCLGLHQEDAYHVFRQVDLDEKGFIQYDEFITFAQKKAEFAFVFSTDGVHEKSKNV